MVDISEYFKIDKYQGKNDLYNVIVIEQDKIDTHNSIALKTLISQDYDNIVSKFNGTKNALDLGKVRYMDGSGISLILVLNRLSRSSDKKNYGCIALINCQPQIKRLIEISQLEDMVNVVYNINDL